MIIDYILISNDWRGYIQETKFHPLNMFAYSFDSVVFVCHQQSFNKVVSPSFLELGLGDLVSIYSELCELGKAPPIIDADDLQKDPEVSLLLVIVFLT